jgi:hypothetical protein
MIKTYLILTAQILHFTFIGIPLAITLYLTAHLYFETKRIIKWIKN